MVSETMEWKLEPVASSTSCNHGKLLVRFDASKPWGGVCVGDWALWPTSKHLAKLACQKYGYGEGYIDKVEDKGMCYYLTIVIILS